MEIYYFVVAHIFFVRVIELDIFTEPYSRKAKNNIIPFQK
jgi:hypothetical protein